MDHWTNLPAGNNTMASMHGKINAIWPELYSPEVVVIYRVPKHTLYKFEYIKSNWLGNDCKNEGIYDSLASVRYLISYWFYGNLSN